MRVNSKSFWKLSKFGELVQVGYGATFGLGKYGDVSNSRGAQRVGLLLTPAPCYGHTIVLMARISIKSTYALDVDTIRKLERVAARWRVSKSEVLRRAIEVVAREQAEGGPSPLEALDQLQKSLKLTAHQAGKWSQEVRQERVKSSGRREWRRR
jgi:hypothetical protein